MASRIVTPLRVVVAILVALAIAAAALVVILGPEDGRWGISGALGASPDRSESPSSEPVSSPTTNAGEAEPSESPSLSRKEQNIADAKARLVEYYATMSEVANGGYADWERRLGPFWGTPAVRSGKGKVYEQSRNQGISTEGAAVVVSTRTIKYSPYTPGSEEVSFNACIDFSDVKTVDSSDNRIPRDASVPTRYVFTYTLRNQGDGQNWALVSEDPDMEKPC